MQQKEIPLGELSNGLQQFSYNLYQVLPSEGNLFYSPYNISTCLAMALAGACENTKEEMQQSLNLPQNVHEQFSKLNDQILQQEKQDKSFFSKIKDTFSPQKKDVIITTDNKIWPRNGEYDLNGKLYPTPLLKEFQQLLENNYKSSIQQLDFTVKSEPSRLIINDWVLKQTNQKIKDLLPKGSIIATTQMVLTSCIYFKGLWKHPFKKQMTQKKDFTDENNKKSSIDFMAQEKISFNYYANNEIKMVELPYKGDRYVMGLVLPENGKSLNDIQQQDFSLIQSTKFKNLKINVIIPKFKFSSQLSLKDSLQKLGMKDAFDKTKANFAGIDGKKGLYISDVIHQAFVEVEEEGTEAAAATAVVQSLNCKSDPSMQFIADRPFLFYIRDIQSGAILFSGRHTQPSQ